MRVLLVTSSVTFVPDNYDRMVCGLAKHPAVHGLLILENRSPLIFVQGLFLMLSGLAPRFGFHLLRNFLGPSLQRRKDTFESYGKKVWTLPSINTEEALQIVQEEKIDLIFNSRTRFLFKKAILQAPRLGCWNIHHGLLPEQRGLMCDFWSHLHDEKFGFSIHEMTPKLDDGRLLLAQEVTTDRKDYMKSILLGSELECAKVSDLFDRLKKNDSPSFHPNPRDNAVYRSNPTIKDFFKIRLKGVRI